MRVRDLSAIAVLFLFAACQTTERNPEPARPVGSPVSLTPPLGLPPVPTAHLPTPELVTLGEKLFFSPILSVDAAISCATCHDPRYAFTDRRPVSIGVHGRAGSRNAPTVLNTVYAPQLFWDGRAASLEAQASGPMLNALEMGSTEADVERAVAADQELVQWMNKAFGSGPPTMDKITQALAAYERTLLSANSPFDRFLFKGDQDALSASAQRGFTVFRDPRKANCAVCHLLASDHALFTDFKFHNLGAGLNPQGEFTDLGRYTQTNREGDQGAFRTPSLRNVAQTAPYMHDGSLKSLKEVVDFYIGGGSSNPYLDPQIKPLTHLTKEERADLVAFLESLTSTP